jgi:hypothetical protein
MDFERWFKERTSRFERILMVSAISLLALLFVTQALLTQPAVRQILSLVDRLEGTPYDPVIPDQPTGARPGANDAPQSLELRVVGGDGSELEVRVNGEVVTTFGDNPSVVLTVRDGDFVEIDSETVGEEVKIEVTEISEGVLYPARGKLVTYFGRSESVGWVVVEGTMDEN